MKYTSFDICDKPRIGLKTHIFFAKEIPRSFIHLHPSSPPNNVDLTPITLQAYGGFAHSFVYVDYYCDKETILQAIPRIAGYEPLFTQEITQEELSPHPQVKVFLRRSDFYPPSLDEPIDEMMKRTQHGADPKEAIV